MTPTHIWAISRKQAKDTLKNKSVFLPFLIFPVMAIVMEQVVKVPGMPENYFVTLFAVMYLGMAPLVSMASLLAEEKETCTLRMLRIAGVKPVEYLLGAGGFLFCFCVAGLLIFAAAGTWRGRELWVFLGLMIIGALISLLAGATIGILSKNQPSANAAAMPVMMIFSFLPMLSMFNDTIKSLGRILYTCQLHRLLMQSAGPGADMEALSVIFGNFLVFLLLFGIVYRRRNVY